LSLSGTSKNHFEGFVVSKSLKARAKDSALEALI
jgi:hypothetical protein